MDLKLKNKKVTVMGVGLNDGGVGVIKFLIKSGAKVLATDLKNQKQLAPSLKKLKGLKVKYVLGRHREEDFKNTDLIIKNPAVRDDNFYLKIARQFHVSIETEISLFYQLLDINQPLIAVTGTKGKTTTTHLIYEFFKVDNKKAVLAGNLGISAFNVLPKIKKDTTVILEISAQQLESFRDKFFRPQRAVITNIWPDHLDRYGDLYHYSLVKSLIFKNQTKKDFLIVNYDDFLSKKTVRKTHSKIIWFSALNQGPKIGNLIFVKNNVIFYREKNRCIRIFDLKQTSLLGEHQKNNILAAIGVGLSCHLSVASMIKVLKTFRNPKHRFDLFLEKDGVKYINDSAATMPQATEAALSFLKQPIILILGGRDKKLDFRNLIKMIIKSHKIKKIILLNHPAYDASCLIKEKLKNKTKLLVEADSMLKAVKMAVVLSRKGDVVLLSPSAASFGMFNNEFERGLAFVALVKKYA